MGSGYTGGSGHQLWYAHYDNNPSFSDFRSFGGWNKPAIKQYAGDKSVCGAGVDLNYYWTHSRHFYVFKLVSFQRVNHCKQSWNVCEIVFHWEVSIENVLSVYDTSPPRVTVNIVWVLQNKSLSLRESCAPGYAHLVFLPCTIRSFWDSTGVHKNGWSISTKFLRDASAGNSRIRPATAMIKYNKKKLTC